MRRQIGIAKVFRFLWYKARAARRERITLVEVRVACDLPELDVVPAPVYKLHDHAANALRVLLVVVLRGAKTLTKGDRLRDLIAVVGKHPMTQAVVAHGVGPRAPGCQQAGVLDLLDGGVAGAKLLQGANHDGVRTGIPKILGTLLDALDTL